MPAQDRRYLILLDPGDLGVAAVRAEFFDRLRMTDAGVVEDGGANRLVIAAAPEVAERLRSLAYVRTVEPYA
ncbi:hypothetical protein ACRS5S_32610 [Nocardia asiatica]|uniref:hypothetical protein n=1 Tax=Nocardia asiatica TaxID=209252 RepID=UPI002457E1AF|nr:hypothetical protein [Nocardia asiatica]